jgi:hypothetical protein
MNYSQKIQRLRDRRQGLYSRDGVYDFVEALKATAKVEKFQQLAEPEAVKYAIGAMQAVDSEYTRKSYAEGNRVRDRLAEGLVAAGIPAAFDYQGSVPLDVHVRGNSDIDLLVLHDGFVTVEAAAQAAYSYYDLPGKTPAKELAGLRKECIAILERRFWGAKVDSSPSKAISLTGGSLQRAVDVIPSHWHDTFDWNRTGDKRYRDIYVLDRKAAQRVKNRPFMHIGLIEDKCVNVRGGLRKCIRLMKNLRYDANKTIDLSSYDIAAIAGHMTDQDLVVPFGVDLLLVDRVRGHLKLLLDIPAYRATLLVPDGSRLIFDKPEKTDALADLYKEVEQLSADLAREINPLAAYAGLPRDQVLNKAVLL